LKDLSGPGAAIICWRGWTISLRQEIQVQGIQAILDQTRRLISASREAVTTTFKSLDHTGELISRSRKILGIREGNELDGALALATLRRAEDHIAEAEAHIRRQREIVADLERDGHDTALAKDLLEIFEGTLANHIRLRDRLLEETRRDDVSGNSRE